jgi:general secretion pathway protein D
VVLGGLIQDSQTGGEQRVPFLGRIPVIGEAFKSRSAKKTKTNLMVFIQPRILRDGLDAAFETNQKYNYMRDQQRKLGPQREVLPLLPGTPRAILPELPVAPAPQASPEASTEATPAAAASPDSATNVTPAAPSP